VRGAAQTRQGCCKLKLVAIITTESIYALNYEAGASNLVYREGLLELDDPAEFLNGDDTLGPIHIREGLTPLDVAIFLRFRPDSGRGGSLPSSRVGYLVGVVDDTPEGSGILVSGAHLEASPVTWVSPRIKHVWSLLSRDGYTPGPEFGLHSLDSYLRSKGLLA
jgi:hypothetical protein